MHSQINIDPIESDFIIHNITHTHKIKPESIKEQLEKTSIMHHFKDRLFPHAVGMTQKSILEKYNGKPLSDNNLNEINNALIRSIITPSQELMKMIESSGFKTQSFTRTTSSNTQNRLDKHFNISLIPENQFIPESSQLLLTLSNLQKLKNILDLYDLYNLNEQQLCILIDHLSQSETIQLDN